MLSVRRASRGRLVQLGLQVESFRVDPFGGVVCGPQSTLAVGATGGFLYLPTCAGTPTGVPTAYTGKVPMLYDTTNNKLWIYNGSWRSATFT